MTEPEAVRAHREVDPAILREVDQAIIAIEEQGRTAAVFRHNLEPLDGVEAFLWMRCERRSNYAPGTWKILTQQDADDEDAAGAARVQAYIERRLLELLDKHARALAGMSYEELCAAAEAELKRMDAQLAALKQAEVEGHAPRLRGITAVFPHLDAPPWPVGDDGVPVWRWPYEVRHLDPLAQADAELRARTGDVPAAPGLDDIARHDLRDDLTTGPRVAREALQARQEGAR